MRKTALSRFKRAFTLVELMVSMGVFIAFLGVVSTSYINIMSTQRQANGTRRAISEVRDFMETLANDFRLGTIDYDCYDESKRDMCPISGERFYADRSGFSGRRHYLAIINKDYTEKTIYRFDSDDSTIKLRKFKRVGEGNVFSPLSGFEESDKSGRASGGWRLLFSDSLKISNAIFELYPYVDPYSRDNYKESRYQFQPGVKLLLTFAVPSRSSVPRYFNLQTSFSSRVYEPK